MFTRNPYDIERETLDFQGFPRFVFLLSCEENPIGHGSFLSVAKKKETFVVESS